MAPILMVAGMALSAYGAAQAGNAQAAADQYNAKVEQVRAQESMNQGASQSAIDEQAARRKIGDIAAAYGAGGVDATGSPLMVMMDQATQGEMQRRLDIYRGQTGALAATQQATLDTANASAASSAGDIKAGSTLLTGVANLMNSYAGGSLLGSSSIIPPSTSAMASTGRAAGPV